MAWSSYPTPTRRPRTLNHPCRQSPPRTSALQNSAHAHTSFPDPLRARARGAISDPASLNPTHINLHPLNHLVRCRRARRACPQPSPPHAPLSDSAHHHRTQAYSNSLRTDPTRAARSWRPIISPTRLHLSRLKQRWATSPHRLSRRRHRPRARPRARWRHRRRRFSSFDSIAAPSSCGRIARPARLRRPRHQATLYSAVAPPHRPRWPRRTSWRRTARRASCRVARLSPRHSRARCTARSFDARARARDFKIVSPVHTQHPLHITHHFTPSIHDPCVRESIKILNAHSTPNQHCFQSIYHPNVRF